MKRLIFATYMAAALLILFLLAFQVRAGWHQFEDGSGYVQVVWCIPTTICEDAWGK